MDFAAANIRHPWDLAAKRGEFPMLDNGYYYHADQKLTVFRDQARWAMLVELLQYNNHDDDVSGIFNVAHVFGNCLQPLKPDAHRMEFFQFAADGDTVLFLEDASGYSFLNPLAGDVLVKGSPLPIRHELAHYSAMGIDLEVEGQVLPWEFLRGLVPEHSDRFWVSREEIAHQIPMDLPILLTLREWHHPDIAALELPSASTTFLQLSKVIATGDLSQYAPLLPPNTHWINWPDGGTL